MSIMEVPEGWQLKTLNTLATVGQGGTPSRAVFDYWNGDIPWLSSGELRNNRITDSKEKITKLGLENSSTKLCPKGTILIAMTGLGLTRGRTSLLGIEACANQSCAHIILKDKQIIPKYLWLYLQSQYWIIRSVYHGSGQPGINTSMIRSWEIPFPSSVTKQKNIVQKLELILGKLEKKKTEILSLIEQNKRRIDFFEKHWLSYIINSKMEKHYQRKEWTEQLLKDVCDFYVPMRDKPQEFSGDIPWLRINEITEKYVDGRNAQFKVSQTTINEMKLRVYPIGTVLFSCSASIGTCAITKSKVVTNQTFIGIYPKTKIFNEFLYYYLLSKVPEITALGKGTTILYVSRKKFENLKIPLPSLSIQKEIVQNITNTEDKFEEQIIRFENIKENYESIIKYVNNIKLSVLNSAFSGKLIN